MNLEQLFYLFGIVYFAMAIIFMIGVVFAGMIAAQKIKEMQEKAEERIESLKSSVQSIPVMKISSAGAALPIASWIIKQIMNRRKR